MSNALKAAIEANDPDAVCKALKGVKDINRKLPGARSPLLHACSIGADKVLEALSQPEQSLRSETRSPGIRPLLLPPHVVSLQ